MHRPAASRQRLASSFLAIVLCSALASPLESVHARAGAGSVWHSVDAGIIGRAGLAATSTQAPDNGIRVVVLGGGAGREGAVNTNEVYDSLTRTTHRGRPMPAERSAFGATEWVDQHTYVIGGRNAAHEYVASVDIYDERTDAWARGAAPMPTPRDGLAVASDIASGRIYAIGGSSKDGISNALEAFDPGSGAWSQLAPMPTRRALLAAAVSKDGRVFALGGLNESGLLATVEVYHPETDTWTTGQAMPTPRQGLAAIGVGDTIYTFGGNGRGIPAAFTTVEGYDAVYDTWRPLSPMPASRTNFAVAGPDLDGRLYVMGGLSVTPLGVSPFPTTIDVYSPADDPLNVGRGVAWQGGAPMPTAREGLATVATCNRILTIGGFAEDGAPSNAVDLYDPSATSADAAWTSLPPLAVSRAFLGAASFDPHSCNAPVYAIGGTRGQIDPIADPITAPFLTVEEGNEQVVQHFRDCQGIPDKFEAKCRPAPHAPPPHLSSGTYVITYAWRNAVGTTLMSPEASIQVYDGQFIDVDLPEFPATATGADVYVINADLDRVLNDDDNNDLIVTPSLSGSVTEGRHFIITAPWGLGRSTPKANTTGGDVSAVEKFEPQTHVWSAVTGLPGPGFGFTALVEDAGFMKQHGARAASLIYVFGGAATGSQDPGPEVLAYDSELDQWLVPPKSVRMPFGRALLAGAASRGRIYLLGGSDGHTATDTVQVYDPNSGTFSLAHPMLTPRQGLAAATGPDGKIYAIGGSNAGHVQLETAEVCDPATDTWTALPSLRAGARNLAAAAANVRGDLRIFAFGGHGEAGPVDRVDVYSPPN